MGRNFLWVYFSPFGRTSRRTFWLYLYGPILFVSFLAGILGVEVHVQGLDSIGRAPISNLLVLLTPLALFGWICIAVAVKRLHDFNASGWWAISMLVPYLNALVLIVIGLIPGTQRENRFGQAAGQAVARSNNRIERTHEP